LSEKRKETDDKLWCKKAAQSHLAGKIVWLKEKERVDNLESGLRYLNCFEKNGALTEEK